MDASERLRAWLQDHEAPCPRCRRRIGFVDDDRCPHCRTRLALGVAPPVPPAGGWLLAVYPHAASLPVTLTSGVIIIAIWLTHGPGGSGYGPLIHVAGLGLSATALVALLVTQRRFRHARPRVQRILAILSWLVAASWFVPLLLEVG